MAYKVLGRKAAAATTEEELYTVPSSSAAVVSSIVIANRSTSARTYRLAVKPTSGTSIADEHYIAYDVPIAANDSVELPMKQVLGASKTITGGATATSVNFHISGVSLT